MRRLLGGLLICLEIWVPAAVLSWPVCRPTPAHADQFLDRARQGQALGRGLIPNPEGMASQDGAGNLILNWGSGNSTTFRPQDLFPDLNNAPNPNAGDLAGSEAGIQGLTNSTVRDLQTSSSYTGQAYRVLIGSTNRARVNMSHDPIWSRTDLAIQQAVSGELAECHTQYVQLAGNSTAHVPDYRTCERLVYPTSGVCNLYHDYSITVRYEIGVTASAWTDDDANFKIDLRVPALLQCWGAHGVSGCTISGEPVDYETVCGGISEGVIKILAGAAAIYDYDRHVRRSPWRAAGIGLCLLAAMWLKAPFPPLLAGPELPVAALLGLALGASAACQTTRRGDPAGPWPLVPGPSYLLLWSVLALVLLLRFGLRPRLAHYGFVLALPAALLLRYNLGLGLLFILFRTARLQGAGVPATTVALCPGRGPAGLGAAAPGLCPRPGAGQHPVQALPGAAQTVRLAGIVSRCRGRLVRPGG